jgi:hypothetical protein
MPKRPRVGWDPPRKVKMSLSLIPYDWSKGVDPKTGLWPVFYWFVKQQVEQHLKKARRDASQPQPDIRQLQRQIPVVVARELGGLVTPSQIRRAFDEMPPDLKNPAHRPPRRSKKPPT